ncbi:MAG: hypothetical protein IJ460_04485 [Clostridia bacterium]|nr:hypothetical protein [Clostridia bacterium]
MRRAIPDIRFYNFDFELLHVENKFISSSWTLYYNDIGNLEAHFDVNSDTLPVVMDNNYLIAVQGKFYAVITGKKIGDDLTIYGRSCNWLFTKRTVAPFALQTVHDYTFVDNMVTQAYSDSKYPVNCTLSGGSAIDIERTDRCTLFELIKESLSVKNRGHKFVPDFANKKWLFSAYSGNSNSLVISLKNRNAYEVTQESDLLDECCTGWYHRTMENGGEWNANSNRIVENGEETERIYDNTPDNFGKYWSVIEAGERFDIQFEEGDYLICRDPTGKLEKSDNYDAFWTTVTKASVGEGLLRWENILTAGTETEANIELSKSKASNAIQAKTSGIYFGEDYMLGDVVSVEWQIGQIKKRSRKRICGVNIWYERENIGEEPILEDV